MITIRKIAHLAGVSRGTVDRVVNGRGGVDKVVAQRIQDIIDAHGYKPNRAAKTLANRHKSHLIGVLSASIDNMFFRDVVSGIKAIEDEVKELGVSLLYQETARFSVQDHINSLDEMLAAKVDALAVNPVNDDAVVAKLREFNARGIPVITFNSDIEGVDKLSYIGCDYRKSGSIGAGLIGLVCQGATQAAVITGSMKSLGHSQRVDGFRETLTQFHPDIEIKAIVQMFDDEITSYREISRLIEREPGIEAFFFAAAGKEGGIRAINESAIAGKAKIVTVDIDAFTRDMLMQGVVSATVCQQPYIQGYLPIKQLANYLLYDEPPTEKIQYTKTEILIPQCL